MKLKDILSELEKKLNLERDIFIFEGINIAVRRFAIGGVWEIKTQDCSRCGVCCKMMTGKSFPFSTPDGCAHLEQSGNEYLCGLSYFRPNGCAVSEMNLKQCTVKWTPVK